MARFLLLFQNENENKKTTCVAVANVARVWLRLVEEIRLSRRELTGVNRGHSKDLLTSCLVGLARPFKDDGSGCCEKEMRRATRQIYPDQLPVGMTSTCVCAHRHLEEGKQDSVRFRNRTYIGNSDGQLTMSWHGVGRERRKMAEGDKSVSYGRVRLDTQAKRGDWIGWLFVGSAPATINNKRTVKKKLAQIKWRILHRHPLCQKALASWIDFNLQHKWLHTSHTVDDYFVVNIRSIYCIF